MELFFKLSQYNSQPIPHHLLINMLKAYKRPNDKIHELINERIILPLKKGLYITGENIGGSQASKEVIANLLYGPSYISFDYALATYGLIPERVVQLTSVCTKPSKIISNALGSFTYKHLPLPYYSYGIEQHQPTAHNFWLMASPEKALCDKIICTPGISLRSIPETLQLLISDWRMDEDGLKKLKIKNIQSWLNEAPKKSSLMMLVNALKKC